MDTTGVDNGCASPTLVAPSTSPPSRLADAGWCGGGSNTDELTKSTANENDVEISGGEGLDNSAVHSHSVSIPFVSFQGIDTEHSPPQQREGSQSARTSVVSQKRQTGFSRITQQFFRSRGAYRNPATLSILDLVSTDLDELRVSFVAHNSILNHGDLNDLEKLSTHVEREMRYGEHDKGRPSSRGSVARASYCSNGTRSDSSNNNADIEGDSVWQDFAERSFAGDISCDNESLKSLLDLPSQTRLVLRIWLYDRFVRQKLLELRSKRKMHTNDNFTAVVARGFPNAGSKELMLHLRNAPQSQSIGELDLLDEIGTCLNETGNKFRSNLSAANVEDLMLPLPLFVYVISRALFRLYYIHRFPMNLRERKTTQPRTKTSNAGGASVQGNSSLSCLGESRTNSLSVMSSQFSPRSDSVQPSLQEALFLLEECRRVAMYAFEAIDTEQKGTFSWSFFTDSLTECMEERLRGLRDEDCEEGKERSDLAVFDDCVLEPFPSLLQRSGYVGDVANIRHNPSSVLVEGENDYAVCDSSYRGFIQRRLLVRPADMLLAHGLGSADAWDAERWDAVAGTGSPSQEVSVSGKRFLRYEDGRLSDGGAKQSLLFALHRMERKERGLEEEEGGCEQPQNRNRSITEQKNIPKKPTIEICIEVKDVGPNLPKTIITVSNDLVLRFFNVEQHLWVVPESLTMSLKETVCSIDWCAAAAAEDLPLKTFLFLGTRSGYVKKLDLQAILRKMVASQLSTSDTVTTGDVATWTVSDSMEKRLVQQQLIHAEAVTSICLTASDTLLSSSIDGTIVLSKASNMTLIRAFRLENDGGVRLAYITPVGNTIVTLSASNRVSLWGATHQGSRVDLYDPISPHYFPIVSFVVDESLEQLTTVDTSGHAKVWSLRTSLIKFSFYAVSQRCVDSLSAMNLGDNSSGANGFRLFDMDDACTKRVHPGNTKNLQMSALLQASLAKFGTTEKGKNLHPVRTVAYDAHTRRLFVSGARNCLVCVFICGSVAMKTHSAPPLYVSLCERSRWLVSVSPMDCRVWSFYNSKLISGFKVNKPEFVMARFAPTFESRADLQIDTQLSSAAMDLERYKLDECKRRLPTVDDIVRESVERASTGRRDQSRATVSLQQGGGPAREFFGALATVKDGAHSANRGAGGTSFGGGDKAAVESQADDDASAGRTVTHKVICAHTDAQGRFIFYALGTGDVRMHRTKSGQLVKTLLTMSPSTDLIYAAVLQCRHMYTAPRNQLDWGQTSSPREKGLRGTLINKSANYHDVAFVLQRLLREEYKLPLEKAKTSSVHREVVGMLTPRNSHELCVVYADGVVRFFPLLGSSVHAHRIIIPEFLVSKALSYLRLEKAMMKAASRRGLEAANKRRRSISQCETPETYRSVMVEADAVSFIAVSQTLNLICLVQVNGRVSLMDMSTPVGLAVQVFYVASEVAVVSFLGGYPCLVVGEVQGTIGFYLLKDAALLDMFDDFYKAVLLYRRQIKREASMDFTSIERLADAGVDSFEHDCSSSPRVWWFCVPGTPTALHFDPCCCALYVGTRQGFVTSYLVRRLIVAANLQPSGRGGKGSDAALHSPITTRSIQNRAEIDLCNVLLVLFDLTPDRVMKHIAKCRNELMLMKQRGRSLPHNSTATAYTNTKEDMNLWNSSPFRSDTISRCDSMSTTRSPAENCFGEVDTRHDKLRVSSMLQQWRPSLLWIYETCRSLFHSHVSSESYRDHHEPAFSLLNITTATLSDFLLAAAVLHYTLQLMITDQCVTFTSTGELTTECTGYGAPAGVTLTSQDIHRIRQSIVEEIRYQKQVSEGAKHTGRAADQSSTKCHIEEFVESDGTLRDAMDFNNSLTADWVELIFRRHAVNTVSSTPLSMLSTEGIIERARRERRQRAKLLLQHVEALNNMREEDIQGESTTMSSQCRALSINWNAFLEGAPPDWITEAIRRCRDGVNPDEDIFYTEEDNSVNCITTRRNGVLFVGSGDGSVSVWTPFACARLQEFSPCSSLDSGVQRIATFVKTQFAKQWNDAECLRQRNAYASGACKQKLHEAMMRSITLKYKMAVLKCSGKRYSEVTADGGTSRSRRRSQAHRGAALLAAATSNKSASVAGADVYNLINKPKDLLLAALQMDDDERISKNLLMEDLYFLPMQMSVLSELEDFDPKTYAAAVDICTSRLLKDVCCWDSIDCDNADSGGGGAPPDKVKPDADEAQAQTNPLPMLSQQNIKRQGEVEVAVDSDAVFHLSSHEKQILSFYAETKHRLETSKLMSQRGCASNNAAVSVTFAPLHIRTWRSSSNGDSSLTTPVPTNSSRLCTSASKETLPSYAHAGTVGRPGVIIVAVSDRRAKQLNPIFNLDLLQIMADAQWTDIRNALRKFVANSDGALRLESFQGVMRLLNTDSGKVGNKSGDAAQAAAQVPPLNIGTSSVMTRDGAVRGLNGAKGIASLVDPLITVVPGSLNEYVSVHDFNVEYRHSERTFTRRGSTRSCINAENASIGRQRSFFFTETSEPLNYGDCHPKLTSVPFSGRKSSNLSMKYSTNSDVRHQRGDGDHSEFSDGNGQPPAHVRWGFGNKRTSQRARLSRTGRSIFATSLTTPRRSLIKPQKSAPGSSGESSATDVRLGVSSTLPALFSTTSDFIRKPTPAQGRRVE
uniref:Uncharacterized protein TCIL3000_8_630 n=1 Tax=Trypanosoma congolense (strain IL3000) TaxID=1068625 RepID=G0UR45_TRYCI|nr:unnamed protein product [Trypanosoma congolense IL3000]